MLSDSRNLCLYDIDIRNLFYLSKFRIKEVLEVLENLEIGKLTNIVA
jgi:hypothetical protein